MRRSHIWQTIGIGSALIITSSALQGGIGAQQPSTPQVPSAPVDRAAAAEPQVNDGIPVTSAVVRSRCGTCHPSDDKGRMTRISFRRTTPEGWERTVRRLVSLHNVKLEARGSSRHCL